MDFRAPNRTILAVGFGDFVSPLPETNKKQMFLIAKVSCFSANKGGTTVPRPFYGLGIFLCSRIKLNKCKSLRKRSRPDKSVLESR